jgi:hypothetical protein
LEGTWEEVRARDSQLAGKHVRVLTQNPSGEEKADDARLIAAEQFRLAHEAASRLEAKMPYLNRRDSVTMVREARAGAMFGYWPDE